MRNYKIAAIPADGIGTEVIAAGVSVLETLQKNWAMSLSRLSILTGVLIIIKKMV